MDLGWLWHLLAGLAINAAPAYFAPWWVSWLIVVPLLAAGGYLREKHQAEWKRLNTHKWIEALAWPLGGIVAAGVGLLV